MAQLVRFGSILGLRVRECNRSFQDWISRLKKGHSNFHSLQPPYFTLERAYRFEFAFPNLGTRRQQKSTTRRLVLDLNITKNHRWDWDIPKDV